MTRVARASRRGNVPVAGEDAREVVVGVGVGVGRHVIALADEPVSAAAVSRSDAPSSQAAPV